MRVALRTSALNHLDLWVSKGLPAPRSLPHISGGDDAGMIDGLGAGVQAWAAGDEVVINPSIGCGYCAMCLVGETPYCRSYGVLGEHRLGTFGDLVVVPARNVLARAHTLPWEEAGAYGLAYGTAYRMLRRSRLIAGERLLVVGVGEGRPPPGSFWG